MYIYQVYDIFESYSGGNERYLAHENKISSEGFEKICKEGIRYLDEAGDYPTVGELADWLIDNKGFKDIEIQAFFGV